MNRKDASYMIKRSVTAKALMEHLGIPVDRSGFCKCPFHGEKTGSMKVYPGNRGWYCYGCHTGGSVIDFVMAYYDMGLKDALIWLNNEFSLGMPIGRAMTEEEKRKAAERERERTAKEEEDRRHGEEQRKLLDEWYDYSRAVGLMELDMKDYAPRHPGDEPDPRFVGAVKHMSEMRYRAEYAFYSLDNMRRN